MLDISVDLAGIQLRNPLIVVSGTPGRDGKAIKALAQHKVGAITTKSTYLRNKPVVYQPYMAKLKVGLINADWTDIGINTWIEKDMKIAAEGGVPVIATVGISGGPLPPLDTPLDDYQDAILKLEKAGAAMLQTGGSSELDIRMLKLATETISIPIVAKLGFDEPDLINKVKAVEAAGANIITATGSLSGSFAIDIETGEPILGNPDGTGGLSGPAIKHYSMKAVAKIASVAKVPVIGTGGVTTAEDAIEMMMAGATGVGLCTAPMLEKAAVLDKIDDGIRKFMERKGISSLSEIRGIALKHLEARKKKPLYTYPLMKSYVDVELCNLCGTCQRNCPYDAIAVVETAIADNALCHGCGICVSVCPVKAISLIMDK